MLAESIEVAVEEKILVDMRRPQSCLCLYEAICKEFLGGEPAGEQQQTNRDNRLLGWVGQQSGRDKGTRCKGR